MWNSTIALLVSSLYLVSVTFASEPNWPQFRGPSGQGYAVDAEIPLKFDEETNTSWKQSIPGLGWSTPVVWGDQIWVTTAVRLEETEPSLSLRAIGLEATSGKILHEIELFRLPNPEKIHDDNSYASPTPVIDEQNVYCHFGTFGTAAIERSTGKILWKNADLVIEHQGGPGSSPVGYKDLIILTCDGANEQYVTALDKKSGEIRWKTKRSALLRENNITHRAFATPFLWSREGIDLLISPGADQVHAYDPSTGQEHWHVRYIGFSNVPAPVANETHVFVCTGFYETQLLAIRAEGRGDITETNIDWTYDRSVSTVPSPILIDNMIFTINPGGIVVCLSCETGEVLGKRRFIGAYSASPIYANDKLYFCSEEGKVSLIEADPQMELVQVNRLEGRIKASPAVAGKALYLRTDTHLYRIENQ
ncbi:PQQ-binding-like beta-propeller repeat protein [uncultured Rubinisphaera sp.]|uniref:outer membrane protein assembly factor BamB family protein n=1 Tax=uncultured Rubinisphaera sp. TaxID=1678686 RepID=UPI0030D9CB28